MVSVAAQIEVSEGKITKPQSPVVGIGSMAVARSGVEECASSGKAFGHLVRGKAADILRGRRSTKTATHFKVPLARRTLICHTQGTDGGVQQMTTGSNISDAELTMNDPTTAIAGCHGSRCLIHTAWTVPTFR